MKLAQTMLKALEAIASPSGLWTAVATFAVGVGVWAGLLASDLAAAGQPPAGTQPQEPSAAGDRRGAQPLRLAGSGSNVALLRETVAACQRAGQPLQVTVEPGIGSSGGLRALRDRAVEAALVSRAIAPAELASGELQAHYASVPVAFAGSGHSLANQDTAALLAALAAEPPQWPDGRPLVWALREPSDSGHRVLARELPPFVTAEARARARPAAQVYFHDRTLHAALLLSDASVGLVDASAVRAEGLPLHLFGWGTVQPDAASVASGAWPFVKPHSLVYPAAAADQLAPLLNCLRSSAAHDALRHFGAAPSLL